MGLQDDCILWNKCGSNAEVDNSEIGANGVRTGTITYSAGKFGNGFEGITAANHIRFPLVANCNIGILEFWFKPNNIGGGNVKELGNITRVLGSYGIFFQWYDISPQSMTAFTYNSGFFTNYTFNDFDLAAGQWYHIALWWYNNGGAGEKLGVSLDGVSLDVSVNSSDNAWDFSGANGNNYYIDRFSSYLPPDGIFDNIKMYNSIWVLADVIANKDNEGWPVSGGGRFFQMF